MHEADRLAREIPEVRASSGLWSPETGIIDSHGVMLSLLGELEDAGGQLVLRSPVVAGNRKTTGIVSTWEATIR